jgi:3-deoxy-manno-octulosonate cytidylyltransferase (CMP-KDO synthetase)
VVKAVRGADGFAVYFSRAPVPYDRTSRNGDVAPCRFWQHLGIYAFRADALKRFCEMPPGNLEKLEKLEQLRVVEAGWKIWLEPASRTSLGIDTPQDLEAARAIIKKA